MLLSPTVCATRAGPEERHRGMCPWCPAPETLQGGRDQGVGGVEAVGNLPIISSTTPYTKGVVLHGVHPEQHRRPGECVH